MKPRWGATMLVCMLLAGVAGAQAEWKEFTAKQGRFKAQLPGTPVYEERPMDLPSGPLAMHRYALSVEPAIYIIAYVDFPVKRFPQGPLGALDDIQNGFLDTLKARLLEEKDKTLSGKPGKEFRAETPAQVVALGRSAVVGGRVYLAAAIVPKADARAPEHRRFIDSFRLIPAPPRKPKSSKPKRR